METHTTHLRRFAWTVLPAAAVLAVAPLGTASAMRDNPDVSLPADPAAASAPTFVFSLYVEQLLDSAHAHNVHTALADLHR
ncbi:hypothetical protein [Marmoricola sp. RAF53]|uniref:hypothetical protein n=1 Tax=Marmoricola sp. RAF53 TaxID=3233059 RepID=UPI003F97AE69